MSPQSPLQRRNRFTGLVLIGLSVGIFGSAVVVLFVLPSEVRFLGNILITVAGTGVAAWIALARRHFTRSGESLLTLQSRPPILFLRQFSDDGAISIAGTLMSRRRISWRAFWYRTYEERFNWALRPIGPMIAIGRPDESLPALGAARIYVGDDAWQDKVKQLIEISQLVLLQIGETEGIRWEVQQIVGKVDPAKLILCLPIDERNGERVQQHRYQRFLELNASLFPVALPLTIEHAQFIYFERDWTPKLLEPKTANRGMIGPASPEADRVHLWAALDVLNEEFMRVPTPIFLRFIGVLPLLVVYFFFGTSVVSFASRMLDSTTFFGLLSPYKDVRRELAPRVEELRVQLHKIALEIGEPGSRTIDSGPVAALDPPPVYKWGAEAISNTDVINAELLTEGTRYWWNRNSASVPRSVDLGSMSALASALSQFDTPDIFGNERWASDTSRFEETLEHALNLQYLVVIRNADPRSARDASGDIEIEVILVDLPKQMILTVFRLPMTVSRRSSNLPPALEGASRGELSRALMQRVGGTFLLGD